MAVLKICIFPDPVLKKKALPVEKVDKQIQDLMLNMRDTMYSGDGIGLAANQVGVLQRIIVIDIKDSDDENRPEGFYPLYMANPECLSLSKDKASFKEGCLSLPSEIIDVIRPTSIEATYLDFNNKPQTVQSSGLLARVIQHEIDHLDGKTILEHVSKIKKDMAIKRLVRLNQQIVSESIV